MRACVLSRDVEPPPYARVKRVLYGTSTSGRKGALGRDRLGLLDVRGKARRGAGAGAKVDTSGSIFIGTVSRDRSLGMLGYRRWSTVGALG